MNQMEAERKEAERMLTNELLLLLLLPILVFAKMTEEEEKKVLFQNFSLVREAIEVL